MFVNDVSPLPVNHALTITCSNRVPRRVAELLARLMNHYWKENEPSAVRAAMMADWLDDFAEFPP